MWLWCGSGVGLAWAPWRHLLYVLDEAEPAEGLVATGRHLGGKCKGGHKDENLKEEKKEKGNMLV